MFLIINKIGTNVYYDYKNNTTFFFLSLKKNVSLRRFHKNN